MRDQDRTKEQFINELTTVRERLTELEGLELEREQDEKALRQALGYADAIIETVREALVVLDPNLKVLSVNQSFCDMFGVTSGQTIGSSIFDLGDGQWDIPALRKLLENILPGNTKFDGFEVDHLFPEIGQKIMLLNARRLHEEDGGTQKILLAMEDITARRQGRIELEASETRYRRLFETARDGILILDADTGRISEVNPFLVDLLGYVRNEVVGKKLWEIGAFKDISASKRAFAELRSKGYVRYEDLPLITKDGREVPVEFVSNVYAANHHEVIQCNIRDITKRRRAEEELKKAHDELERRVEERTEELQRAYDKLIEETREREQIETQLRQAQKMEAMGTLTGGIAHDFNNILAAMIGFAELALSRVPSGSPEKHYLQRIFEAGLRGRELIKQMLAFSRKVEQDEKPLNLSSVVKDTMKLMRASIPTTVSIKTDVSRSESGLVFADQTQLEQVLMNLCTNAADAMRERGGVLDVALCDVSIAESDENPHAITPGRYMKLTVRDTGIGIPPAVIDRVFDPFFTTKQPGEGTGLGLSVVHGIVKQHDGYITVESEWGKGSAFTVDLPRIEEGTSHHRAFSDKHMPTGSERILFVEDEEALAEMGQRMLEELGYKVTITTSSIEALALFKSNPSKFDLVVTDQTMPEMTGIDLAKEILAVRARTPLIICTGFSQLVDAEAATQAGIGAFAMKPLTKGEMAKTIRKVLDE